MCNRYAFQDWTTFAAGDISRLRRRRMTRHFAQCADCSTVRHSIQSVWNAAQPFAIEEVNPTMYTQIQSAIAAQSAPRSARPRPSFSIRRLPPRRPGGNAGP